MESRFANKWLVLGIDLITIAFSFVLAYFIRFNLSLNFDWSALEVQLPIVALITLIALLITGTYKGVLGHAINEDMSNILKAIFLFCLLIIPLVLVNWNWGIYPDFNIPLSIIFIYSILAFVGLTGTHYVFRWATSNRT